MPIILPQKLTCLERLYLYLHRLNFKRRQKKQQRFSNKYVVSIGNLSAGGTGKTPMCILLADYLIKKKQQPLAVLRGYKAQLSKQGVLVSDGQHILNNVVREVGDEALLLAEVPCLAVAIAMQRGHAIARYATSANYILLDDAFQNPSVYRDHELVLIDAVRPLSKQMRLFPWGRMREAFSALARADTVLLTRCNQSTPENLSALRNMIIPHLSSEKALFESSHRPVALRALSDNKKISLEKVIPKFAKKGVRAGAFCGIGNANAFFTMLRNCLPVSLDETLAFNDHHAFSLGDMKKMFGMTPTIWITTSKDMVRLKHYFHSGKLGELQNTLRHSQGQTFSKEIFALEIEVEISGNRQQKFLRRVLDI